MGSVAVLGERSGIIRDAFRAHGHTAVSCDLMPSEVPGPHIQADFFAVDWNAWDLVIVHPDCTYICVSGLHWNKKRPERAALTEKALADVRRLLAMPCGRMALENPIGCISSAIRKPDQIIQPWQFGDDASKATCMWLRGLPMLRAEPSRAEPRTTCRVAARLW